MKKRLYEIKKSLEAELYYCALALTLTLPDICGNMEYPNAHGAQRYKNWFNKYAKKRFTSKATVLPGGYLREYNWFSAEECYALRCAYLHAGNYELDGVDLNNIHLHTHISNGKENSYMVRDKFFADWDVIELCNNICDAAEEYCTIHPECKSLVDEIRIDDDL